MNWRMSELVSAVLFLVAFSLFGRELLAAKLQCTNPYGSSSVAPILTGAAPWQCLDSHIRQGGWPVKICHSQVHHSVDMNTVPVEGNNPVTTCRVSKTLCYDRPAAATGKQIDVHSHRVPSWKITCRTVQVVPECLRQYNTCSALHRRSQGIQLKNPEQTPLTHRVGHHSFTFLYRPKNPKPPSWIGYSRADIGVDGALVSFCSELNGTEFHTAD